MQQDHFFRFSPSFPSATHLTRRSSPAHEWCLERDRFAPSHPTVPPLPTVLPHRFPVTQRFTPPFPRYPTFYSTISPLPTALPHRFPVTHRFTPPFPRYPPSWPSLHRRRSDVWSVTSPSRTGPDSLPCWSCPSRTPRTPGTQTAEQCDQRVVCENGHAILSYL